MAYLQRGPGGDDDADPRSDPRGIEEGLRIAIKPIVHDVGNGFSRRRRGNR
jgi:hypothetical protein